MIREIKRSENSTLSLDPLYQNILLQQYMQTSHTIHVYVLYFMSSLAVDKDSPGHISTVLKAYSWTSYNWLVGCMAQLAHLYVTWF